MINLVPALLFLLSLYCQVLPETAFAQSTQQQEQATAIFHKEVSWSPDCSNPFRLKK
jgi:hypothetical protein